MEFSIRFDYHGRRSAVTWRDGEVGGFRLALEDMETKALDLCGERLGLEPSAGHDWQTYVAQPAAFMMLFERTFPGAAFEVEGDDPYERDAPEGLVY